jgi:hypothetical protein
MPIRMDGVGPIQANLHVDRASVLRFIEVSLCLVCA